MNKTEKEVVVSELADKFKGSAAVFIADYRGLSVANLTQIRRDLDQVQARIHVVKNRLMKRALGSEVSTELMDHLKGPTAIAFVDEDPVGAAKVLAKYQKEFEPLEVRAGYLKGEVLSSGDVDALAKLPSKEELYAKLLRTLSAPATNMVRVLQAVSEKLVRALDAIRNTKES